jgi:hypothetical protein
MKNSQSEESATRWARAMPLALLMFAVAACEPEQEVAPTSPAYEQSLVESGLRPMDERKATALLSNATVYATYVLTGQKWIEYVDGGGVVVRSSGLHDSAAAGAGRPLLFGSWWWEGDRICFAYGRSRFAECYRLYYRDGSLLYVQTESGRQIPAGALLAYSTGVRKGNSESFPLIGD